MPMDLSVTTDFAYLGLHGLKGGCLQDYEPSLMAPWAEHIRSLVQQDISVYAYFNNDGKTRASKNARELTDMIHPDVDNSLAKVG